MSTYGDLSKAQREFLQRLFQPAGRAASIETALVLWSSTRMRNNLVRKGLISATYVDGHVWRHSLTVAGWELMQSLDYRHSHPRGVA